MYFERKKVVFNRPFPQRLPRFTSNELYKGAFCALTSFFSGICPLPLSVYPLGIAFFCASSGTALFAAAGLLISCFFTRLPSAAYLLAVLSAVGLRAFNSLFIDAQEKSADKPKEKFPRLHSLNRLFSEALPLRAASASVSVFALSLYSVVKGGFRYYDLFGAIFAVLTASAATVIFYGAFAQRDSEKKDIKIPPFRKKAADLALAATLCISLGSLPVKGVSIGLAAAFIFTNHFCLRYGLIEACLSSLLCGAVCGVENIPVLIVSAFTAYCVLDVSPTLAAAVSCIAGTVCGVMLSGSAYMSDPFLSLLLGLSVYATVKKISASGNPRASSVSAFPELSASARLKRLEASISTAKKALCESSALSLPPSFTHRLLELISKEAETEATEDSQLSLAIARRLYELGFGRVNVLATGKRHPQIHLLGERLFGSAERIDFIRRRLEEMSQMTFTHPRITDCDGSSALVLHREPAVSCRHAIAQAPLEQVCGDFATAFCDSRRSFFYALICDGMGSGEKAQAISARVSETLRLLLLCGFSPKEAIGFVCEELAEHSDENGEMTATIDLLSIDLYTGKSALYKSGAAPSYLIRQGDIIRLSACTVPVGIMRKSDVKKIEFELGDSDLLVMVSDGVSECENDSLPLLNRLNSIGDLSPEELTADIIEISKRNRRNDDLSAIAVKIFPHNY